MTSLRDSAVAAALAHFNGSNSNSYSDSKDAFLAGAVWALRHFAETEVDNHPLTGDSIGPLFNAGYNQAVVDVARTLRVKAADLEAEDA